jgi:phosphoglycolate phosphatase-like HAD superfamily hydrolase
MGSAITTAVWPAVATLGASGHLDGRVNRLRDDVLMADDDASRGESRRMSEDLAVFFDIGDTLASAVVDAGGISHLDVFPFVPEVLTRLRAAGGEQAPVRVGLMSNTGNATEATMTTLITDAGLLPLVDADLCLFSSIEGRDKSQPAFFTLGRDRAGLPAARCLFVGEDAGERRVAESAGLRTSPHPLHALHLVEAEFATAATGSRPR